MSQRQRKYSTAKELRVFLVHLLCILTLVQGPPLEAAEQKVRERTLWVGEAEAGDQGVSLAEKATETWQDLKKELAEGAEVLKAQWVQASAETPKLGKAGQTQAQQTGPLPPLTDLPPDQVIPPPPKPPGVNTDVQKRSQAVAPRGVTAAPQAATVAVVPSFNLLSISWQPSDPSPASVLAPIASAVERVYAFDACDPVDKWKLYDPAAPGASDLTSITPAKGFWLEASQAITLPEGGPVPASVSIPLCVGWNLIGFPKSSARPVASALQSIEGKYIRLFSFEPTDVQDPWEVYDVAVPEWANDMKLLQPGRGYWIYITEATTLTFSNEDDLPSVEILSPSDLGEVVKQTPVLGTVRSPALASWTLSQREVDTTTWTQIATGTTPVEAGTLGTFDPTLLENGLYELRLQAFDIHGNGISDTITVVVAGQRKIGNFALSFVDLEVQVAGIPIQVIRSYDSRRKDKKGDFGYGWTLDIRQGTYRTNGPVGRGWEINRGLVVGDDGAAVNLPCVAVGELRGHTATVRLSDREFYRFKPKLIEAAPSPGGCFAKVAFDFVDGPVPGAILAPVGGAEVFWSNGSNELLQVDTLEPFDAPVVTLTTRDGRVFEVSKVTGITKVKDSNDNQLTITDGAITHSAGLSVELTRDSEGRVSRIVDLLGEDLNYTYDSAGDLTVFSDREDAATTFTYYNGHYLETIKDPLGRTPIRNEYGPDGRLTKHIDAYGKEIVYEHRLALNQELVTNRLNKSRLLEYDDRGNVTREINEEQEETIRTYDLGDNLLTELDPLQNLTRNTYSQGNLTSTTDPLGNVTSFTYNSRGDLLTMKDPRGNVTTNVYDSKGHLLRSTDAQGQITTYVYDRYGNLLSETDPLGNTSSSVFDKFGRLEERRDAFGHVTQQRKDLLGNLTFESTTRTRADGSLETLRTRYINDRSQRPLETIAADGSKTKTEYNASGQVSATVDALGQRTTFTYDDLGRQTRTTYADETFEEKFYDAENRLTESRDREGRPTTYTYDDVGRPLATTYPGGATTQNVYDGAGRLMTSIDARNKPTTYEYDKAGRRKKVINALGFATEFSYDAAGNRTSVKDAKGNITAFVYDSLNRQVRTVFSDGTDMRTGYDVLGRRISSTDQAGKVTQFAYDRLGRLASVKDALDQVTSYGYDEVGNRISQTDANNHTTKFEYDAVGRQTKRILPGGAFERFTYDAIGNRKSRTDFNNVTTLYNYDNLHRLTQRVYPGNEQVSFTYTATGRRKTAVDSRGTTTYEYDNRDRLNKLIYPDGRELQYSYDQNNNREALTAVVGESTLTSTYTYDDLNRLETIIDPEGGTTVHGYDPVGNRAMLQHPNGVVTSYTYDPLNRLKNITAISSAGNLITSFSYTLGPTGNRKKIVELDGTTKNYTYDDLYRLTAEEVTLNEVPRWSNTFVYDAVGNRQTQNRLELGGATRSVGYSYDDRDRLLTEDSVNYGWDQNGNLISKSGAEGATYEWDKENRLKTVVLANGTAVEHSYDVDGTRVRTVTTPSGGPAQTVEYMVDTSGGLSQVVLEGASTTAVSAYYVRGDDLISVIRPVEDGLAEVRNYHADGLGSIRALTDQLATVTDRWQFEAFGDLARHDGSDPNAFLFAGEPLDPNVGWYYNRARWMNTRHGRFGRMDPFSGRIQDPRTLHRYLYAANEPSGLVDPNGLEFSIGGLAASMAIGGAINGIFTAVFSNHEVDSKEFWKELGLGVLVGAITAPVGGPLARAFGAIAKQTVRPLLALIGRMDRIILAGKTPTARLLVRISRFFLNTNSNYPGVKSTYFGQALSRLFPNVRWEQHHVLVQQAWSRVGSQYQLFDDLVASRGLQRLGNGLWNLLPIPASLNGYLGRSPVATQLFATAYYSILAYGPWHTLNNFLGDEDGGGD